MKTDYDTRLLSGSSFSSPGRPIGRVGGVKSRALSVRIRPGAPHILGSSSTDRAALSEGEDCEFESRLPNRIAVVGRRRELQHLQA